MLFTIQLTFYAEVAEKFINGIYFACHAFTHLSMFVDLQNVSQWQWNFNKDRLAWKKKQNISFLELPVGWTQKYSRLMSFSSHFCFLFFRWLWPTNLRNVYLHFFKSLACLDLQMETIVKKITQPMLPKTKNEPGIS